MPSISRKAKHAAARRSFGILPTGGKHAVRPTRRARRRALAAARLAR